MTAAPKTFEEAMAKLEEIVSYLERGNIPLEEAVNAYEQGMALKKFCFERLEQAQLRIQKMTEIKEPDPVA